MLKKNKYILLMFQKITQIVKNKLFFSDLECIIEKINWWINNSENLSATKVSGYISWDFSMPATSSFMYTEIKIVWKKLWIL